MIQHKKKQWILLTLLMLAFTSANASSGVTITPTTHPKLTISPNDTQSLSYEVRNQSNETINLSMQPLQGIEATKPCQLQPQGQENSSCTLQLTLNGADIPEDGIQGGPTLCQINEDGQLNLDRCYHPSKNNLLNITKDKTEEVKGYLKCWGKNEQGQLGLGDTKNRGVSENQMGEKLPFVNLGTGRVVKQVVTSENFSCAILDNDQLKCWGSNKYGQLGLGDNNSRGDEQNEMADNLPAIDLGSNRTAKKISVGTRFFSHACAILDDGSVKCWGNNNFGQLGLGDTISRGIKPNQMGDKLPVVDLGKDRKAVDISLGNGFSCALLDNGAVKCWGKRGAQLGIGNNYDNPGHKPNEMGDKLPEVNLGKDRTAKSISAGYNHVCALLDDGNVKCWGYNYSGQLGIENTKTKGNTTDEMGDNLPIVNLGKSHTAKAISSGYDYTCALLDDHSVKCWGYNLLGQLGLGDTINRGDKPNQLMGENLPTIDLGAGHSAKAIYVGVMHACAVLDNDTIKCWGINNNGELGLGSTSSHGSKPDDMGDNLPEVNLGNVNNFGEIDLPRQGTSSHTCVY